MKDAAILQPLRSLLIACVIGLCTGYSIAGTVEDDAPIHVTGKLTLIYADDFEGKHAELQYFIEEKQSRKQYRLQFDGKPPNHLRTGMTITARGQKKGKEIFLAANGVTTESTDTALPATAMVSGEQTTLVMVANFTDADVACSIEAIRDLMFTDAADQSIDDLYQETSQGGIWLTGQVTGPFTINYSSTACDYTTWAQAADDAARASGVEPNNYAHKVYVLPPNGCFAAGIGSVGGNPSSAWIFQCGISDVYGHEFGHNLGMSHAATPSSEYGDNTDIMGISQNRLRQINAPHKEQMGWLSGIKVLEVSQSGYYDIAPLELDTASALAPQALKIFKPDTNEYYYISYRRGVGFDINLNGSLYLDRISVHRYAGDGSAQNTYLLAVPTDGEKFVDALNGVTVTQLSHNADYAVVEISLNGVDPTPVCTASTPQIVFSPISQSARGGSTLNYNVMLTNTDSDACASSTFALNDSIPAGWIGTVSPASLSLAPGQTGTAVLSVTSAADATVNTYGVSVNAVDGSEATHAAYATASYSVVESCAIATPDLVISPTSQSGDAGATLVYTVSLTNKDTAACSGSFFELTITSLPAGWSGILSTNTLALVPGGTGNVTFPVTSANATPPGSYTLQVALSDAAEPAHAGTATATYVVNDTATTKDSEPPTTPTGVSASENFKQVNLSWNASSDNVGVAGYEVLRDGMVIANIGDSLYTDTTGLDGITYQYSVRAYDEAGNRSSESAPVTAGKTKAKGKGSTTDSGGTTGNGGSNGKGKR